MDKNLGKCKTISVIFFSPAHNPYGVIFYRGEDLNALHKKREKKEKKIQNETVILTINDILSFGLTQALGSTSERVKKGQTCNFQELISGN